VTTPTSIGAPTAHDASPSPAPTSRSGGWAVAGVVLALAGVAVWGAALQGAGTDLKLFAAPFFSNWGPRLSWRVAIPILLAVLIAGAGPRHARELSWRPLMAASWIATLVWSVALAASTSWAGLTRSLRSHYDYAAALPAVRRAGLGDYVRTYVTQLAHAPTHVKSHPPGMLVVLRSLEVIGLPGSGWAAALIIAVAATVPVAVAITVRRLGSDAAARAVVPFLVCGPWTLLAATAADGVFAALVVWGVAVLAIAATAAGRWTAPALALTAGALLATSLYFSYGLVPLVAALSIAVLLSTRRHALLWPAVIGGAAVAAIWTLAGFGWFDGFNAARGLYRAGAAAERPYSYFVVANLVVFAVMLGPAVIAALTLRWRSEAGRGWSAATGPASPDLFGPPLRWLVAASLVAVAVADLSGLSKGEVERIWLPFLPFATVIVVRLAARPRVAGWIAAQAAVAIALQTLLVWAW
jgi:methylthioxylose transferase